MLKHSNCYKFIGISGSARVGKDTLCRGIIRILKQNNIIAERCSIAGDLIKKDLNKLLLDRIKLDTFTENTEKKEIIRPLLVEYGKLMRKLTKGRYFLDNFDEKQNIIHIIPDIRYCEYEKDEIHWLKNEKNGFLIYLERENIQPANETEEKNNKIIRTMANYYVNWKSLNENDPEDLKKIDSYAKKVVEKILPLSDRALLGS
jgi:uncharacterized protein Smg (DUF494 family)